MNILEWIDVGKVSAERDENLHYYFSDNGILKNIIASPSSFLILGRKGAGKTALFNFLKSNENDYLEKGNKLTTLNFDDYDWNVHTLLFDSSKAESMAYKQSWIFVILVESIKQISEYYKENRINPPKLFINTNKLLEKLFESPIPSLSKIIGRKILGLSKLKLPSGGLDLESGDLDSISINAGEITFEEVRQNHTLQSHLAENIKNIIAHLQNAILSLNRNDISIFIAFDRVDEAWDESSFQQSKKVIAGLISANDYFTSKFKNLIRPILFLREDIFHSLSINDANKLLEDCGRLLSWKKESLEKLILERINYFAKNSNIPNITSIDNLFDKKEMRQRTKPFTYILKRTMMRPRDLISYMRRIIETMKENNDDPFQESKKDYKKLETESIYLAEPGYSEWLKQEIIDEWKVQKPEIFKIFSVLQNNSYTTITKEEFINGFSTIGEEITNEQANEYIRFLFNNSIVGFKIGSSNEWKYKCFYPTQGFIDSPEYRVHDGLSRGLNLKETRGKDN
ncbi:ATPase [Leptospira ognonensis]|uniref:ATPase n=1 Tax=Leptospira ognonensis TaxID=2484945 RepID=A0A4R9K0P7_9LEPT|nr:ATPase [Leptospira ognonensis]TGL58681.1 ATPase [Leptospira ognonensis]